MRALAILTAAAASCGLMSAPIWAMPTTNLVAASSVLVMAQSRTRHSKRLVYSITSSARASNVGGIVIPIACAALSLQPIWKRR